MKVGSKMIQIQVFIPYPEGGVKDVLLGTPAQHWTARISHIRVRPEAIAYVVDPDWWRPIVWHDNPLIEKIEREVHAEAEKYHQPQRIGSYIRLVTGEVFVSPRTNDEIHEALEDAG